MEQVLDRDFILDEDIEPQYPFSIEEQKLANQSMADFYAALEQQQIKPLQRRG